jgi:hypothetical protein
MIYPASYDITILQNSTWRGVFRATDERRDIDSISVVASGATFTSDCHGLTSGNKVVFTGSGDLPCGLSINSIYYVISTGLTASQFKVSASSGGTEVSVSGPGSGTFYVAKPLVLSGYGIDSDIKGLSDDSSIATFVCTVSDAANGEFTMTMAPSVSSGLTPGRYGYDVSLTTAGGDRYYWLTGTATVQRTYSRN